MKHILSALFFSSLAAYADLTPAQQAEALYQQGLTAQKAGDVPAATRAFTAALQANPRHANARYRLGELKIHGKQIAAKARETKIGSVIVPNIQLDQASLQESLELLGQILDKQSEGKITPNFVLKDPHNRLADRKVSLQLKSVPAKAVIEHLMAQADTKVRYDEYAVVIEPK